MQFIRNLSNSENFQFTDYQNFRQTSCINNGGKMTKTNAVEKALNHYRETHNYPDNMWQTFLHLRRIKQINPSTWCFVQKIKVKWTQNQRRGNYITYEQSKRIKDIYEECQKRDLRNNKVYSEQEYKTAEKFRLKDYEKLIIGSLV